MKKYFCALTAIILAISFSAFNKPFATLEFRLNTDPITAGIVSDPNKWLNDATLPLFGRCDATPADIACTIYLKSSMSLFYHTDASGIRVINDFTYANAQTPKQGYVVIYEAIGGSPNRKITALNFFRWEASANGGLGGYVDITWNLTQGLGGDYDFVNARD